MSVERRSFVTVDESRLDDFIGSHVVAAGDGFHGMGHYVVKLE